MALPGPEAQQLATYIGYRLHGLRGGLASGGLFVAPGFVVIVALSAIYVDYGDVAEVAAAIHGLAAAVVALVALAIVRIGRRSLRSPAAYALAAASLAALLVGVPFPLILAAGALAGVALGRRGLLAPVHEVEEAGADGREDAPLPGSFRRHLAVGLAIWLAPLALTIVAGGVYFDLAWFFTVAALVTFGGAYAVLPFVAGAAVDRFDWLSAEDMVAGLALGETTPGPLIMVNVFVGYVAAYSADGGSHAAGLAGALIVTYATFAPSFLFIFLGAPLIDRAPRTGKVAEALAGVSAAVVGAIAALALFIADTVLLPDGEPDWFALALALAAAAALLRKLDVLLVIALCAAAGLIRELA
jgi:chromate transporter